MTILLSHNDLVMLLDLFTQLSSGYAGLRGAGISQKGTGVCSLRECGPAQRRMVERLGKRDAGPLTKGAIRAGNGHLANRQSEFSREA